MRKKFIHISNKMVLILLVFTGLIFIISGLFYNSFALLNSIESVQFQTERLNYEDKAPGSAHVLKSAKWIDKGKARITFNIDTILKEKNVNKDVLLVLDVSESMIDSKLSRVKTDSKALVNSLLSDSNNSVALITFEDTSSILSGFTNNKDTILSQIDFLYADGGTNYYQALVNADKVLENYVPKENTDCLLLFLTDGYPNIEIPNQDAQYTYLKDKYPYLTIHGIQYEMGQDILDPIINISDYQYIADMNTLNNILFEASTITNSYTSMTLTDYIDNDYFEIDSVSSIQPSFGTVDLTYENNIPRVVWNLDSLRTGSNATLTIDVQLKSDYYMTNSVVPTNKKEELSYELDDLKEVVRSEETPRLPVQFQVSYQENSPSDCTVNNILPSEYYMAYDIVDISSKTLVCDGYQFNGWIPITEGVFKQSENSFIMPDKDVILQAEWSKVSLSKSMDGEIYVAPPPIIQQIPWTYNNELWAYRDSVTKIIIQDSISNILNTKESFDISKAKDGSVLGKIVPNANDSTTYTAYIQGEGGVIANNYSSNLFKDFKQLETIEGLEYFDTSNVISMSYMFRGCEKLLSLDLSHFDTSKVTDMSTMFYSCKALTGLNVSSFDTRNVRNMANMFAYCEKLAILDVNNFDTSNVTDIKIMFSWCVNLTSLNLGNFNTAKVTNMQNLFSGCRNLTSINLSSFNTSEVTNMQNMFNECQKLTFLDISHFDTSKVTSMKAMFYHCYELSNLNLKGLQTSNVTDMQNMFNECQKLTSLDISHFDTSKVTNMSYMFCKCVSITTLDLTNFNTKSVTDMSFMFDSCYKITNLDVSSFDTSNVTDMKNMFQACIALTSLDLNNFNTSKVTNMQRMFSGNFYLNSLNVSSFDTANVQYMAYMFYDCQKLSTLNLNSFNTSKVTDVEHMFDRCTKLTTTLTIRFTSGNYTSMLETAAIYGGKITLNYTSASSSWVDTLLTTKSSNGNVVKGLLVA